MLLWTTLVSQKRRLNASIVVAKLTPKSVVSRNILMKEFRAKRATSQRGAVAATSPSLVVPPNATPAASHSSTPVGAYMSGGSIASAAVSDTSAPWVLDSGASFHMPSESQLVLCQPLTTSRQVQTADGSTCLVTHNGNLATSDFTVSNFPLYPNFL